VAGSDHLYGVIINEKPKPTLPTRLNLNTPVSL
jgi:hypothetical protein